MIICVDFDGTCVTHDYPFVGNDIDNCIRVLHRLRDEGHKFILWTMRSDGREDGSSPLSDAIRWFAERQIPLYGINNNPAQSIWTDSPKAYAPLYIDDAALGCPLIYNETIHGRPFVDWNEVEKILEEKQILQPINQTSSV